MFFRTSASVIALVAGASLAMAADLEGPSYGSLKDDIPAPTAYRWDGVYIGGHIGGAWAKPKGALGCDSITRVTKEGGEQYAEAGRRLNCGNLYSAHLHGGPNDNDIREFFSLGGDYVALTNTTSTGTDSGFIGGIQLGINRQYGAFILGLEADWSGVGDIESTVSGSFDYFHKKWWYNSQLHLGKYEGTGTVSIRNELDWLTTFRGRLGSVMSGDGRFMGYVTAGVAVAQVSNSISTEFSDKGESVDWCDDGCNFGKAHGGGTFYQFGGAIGAGFEYALTNNFTIGAEYLYVGLTGKNENSVTFFGDDGRSFTIREETGFDDIHSVRVKANFKFD